MSALKENDVAIICPCQLTGEPFVSDVSHLRYQTTVKFKLAKSNLSIEKLYLGENHSTSNSTKWVI